MKTIFTNVIDDCHQLHYWYSGECARVECKGYTIVIEANGIVCSEYVPDGQTVIHVNDRNSIGVFYNEMQGYLKNDEELCKAVEDELLIFDTKNQWVAFVIDSNGIRHDLEWSLGSSYLDIAISEVKADFNSILGYALGISS